MAQYILQNPTRPVVYKSIVATITDFFFVNTLVKNVQIRTDQKKSYIKTECHLIIAANETALHQGGRIPSDRPSAHKEYELFN